jgi:uncharacterized repeat protein (TIGR03803 family)
MVSKKTLSAAAERSNMARVWSKPIHIVSTVVFLSILFLLTVPARAATETILHSFACGTTDGCNPEAGVVFDTQGNLYGTTSNGGANNVGIVFKLTPSGDWSILHSFACTPTDGCYPEAGVVLDSKGNLYGTTSSGGAEGGGTVFEVSASGIETTLHNFTCGTDGCYPTGAIVLDSKENLYSTTEVGGANGGGTVFGLVPSTGALTTLYSFSCGTDGCFPLAGVVRDSKGNLYGTTYSGGASGFGTVFKVTPSGTETVIHSFTPNGEDGFYPEAGVILDSEDNVDGTTDRGGVVGLGSMFKVTPSGAETWSGRHFPSQHGLGPRSERQSLWRNLLRRYRGSWHRIRADPFWNRNGSPQL